MESSAPSGGATIALDLYNVRMTYKDIVHKCKKYPRHYEVVVDLFHVIKHPTEYFARIRVGIMKQCVYDVPVTIY